MPLTFPPGDKVLLALGKMTLEFGELEYWVYICLTWLLRPQTPGDAEKIMRLEFNRKAKRLKDVLKARVERRATCLKSDS